jgi:NitT/TauT family transport system substrate-binding protein
MKRGIVNPVGFFLGVCVSLLFSQTRLDAAPVKIRIAVSMPTIGTLPVWIAKDRGFFSKDGLEVEIIAVSGGLDITSLISGSVEFFDSGPSGAIVAAQKGTDIKVVAGTLNAITYNVMGRKGLKGLKDLKGKKIDVGRIYSGSTLVLHEMLASEGLSYPQDYTLLRVGGASDRLASIGRGPSGCGDFAIAIQPDRR